MKNLFKTGAYLMVFAFAGVLFQISCSNSDDANASSSPAQINKIIFTKGVAQNQTIWISNYDGSGLSQIPIVLPSDVTFNGTNGNAYPRLSPDGQKVFFVGFKSNNTFSIFSWDIAGEDLQEIYNGPDSEVLSIGSVN